jgi:hypothetical protein
MDLEELKRRIEGLTKQQHIEILKIIHEICPATLNENKSGIYINMSFLTTETIERLNVFIEYIQDQENMLKPMESQKEDFKNTFFIEKEIMMNKIGSK